MPSIPKTIGLILGLVLAVAGPARLGAQTLHPADSQYPPPGPPPDGFYLSSANPPGGGGELLQAAAGQDTHITEPPVPQAQSPPPVPLSPPGGKPPLPLSPPGSDNRRQGVGTGGLTSGVTVLGSLAVVLGIFLLVAWGMRRAAPAGSIALPGEVFEVLGRAAMSGRQQVHLLRCGKKLVLVSVTPAGAETLTEITDEPEVDRLSGLCQQARPNSATAAFRQVFGQLARGRGAPEFAAAGEAHKADHGLENPDV